MKVLRSIDPPFAGEHVLAVVPPLGPYAKAAAGEPPLRKRLNLFPQRSLTHTALIDEQRSRIADAMRLGQTVAPGVIDGLELAIDGDTLVLLPGHAIAQDGQDIGLAYPLHVPFDAISVISPRVEQELQSHHGGATPWERLSGLQRQVTLARVLSELDGASFLPHAMVLVAIPRTIALDRSGETDSPCPNATDEGASSRAAWEDGFQLAWCPWPDDRALPLWSSDGKTVDPRFRNRLAYAVFNAERQRLSITSPRSMREWEERAGLSQAELDALAVQAALLAERAQPWPWDLLGVPLAIVAFDARFKPAFADGAAVVRQGGGRHNRSALVPWSGDDVLWQARVSQLLEHLAELPPDQRNAAVLAQQFDWLPPAGILPRDAVDFTTGRQNIFPPGFDVQAQPIPVDMVDALIAEASPLMPFNLSLRDQVQVLVPVPPRLYDPDLLKLDLHVHPLFDLEIARLARERLRFLTRRDALRRRFDLLTQAIVGDLPRYPQDDANALPDETGALDAMAFARIHRSSAAADAIEVHRFSDAHVRLEFQASDELMVFVRIDQPPAGIAVQALFGDPPPDGGEVPPEQVATFFWGAQPEASGDRMADLPETGQWTRLSVPMARAGLAGQKIHGLAFIIYSGSEASQVSWGYAGKAASGIESYWVTDALPPGARADDAASWVWVDQGDPADAAEDLAFGVPIEAAPPEAPAGGGEAGDGANVSARPHTRHVSEVDKLLASWTSFRDGILAGELGEPPAGRNAATPPRTIDGGLDELIQRLDGRIKAAGDHVDFGFLRARTDIFRLRQSVLGTDDAGRFLTSPAAAELVKRDENPVATEKEFNEYFKRLGATAAKPPDFHGAAASASAETALLNADAVIAPARLAIRSTDSLSTISRVSTPTTTFALSTVSSSLFAEPTPTVRIAAVPVAETSPIAAVALQPALQVDAGVAIAPELGTPVKIIGTIKPAGIVTTPVARPVQLSVEAPPAVKEVVGASLIGATYNTVTVAERFTLPASVVSSNTAAKGKNDFVVSGLNGLKASGLAVDDLPVFGYSKQDPEDSTPVTARDVLTGVELKDEDAADVGTDLHEAVYFRRGIDAIDNTIRFLRGMELRAEEYRRLQTDAKAARERIAGVTAKIQDLLATLALRLAEVRHDLSVARALRDEEQARVDALIARRRTILAEQVPYLVFRRPRFTPALQDVPLLAAQPADVADPVPRCRGDAHDAPSELMAMVDTLRDVPVRWLKPISQVFVKLDRIVDVERVVTQAQQRVVLASVVQPASPLGVVEGAHTGTGKMLADTFDRHAQRITKSYQQAAQHLAAFDATSWRQAVDKVPNIANIRDLLQAGTQQREVSLAASGLLDDIAGVASCLHASFCTVPPATRLRWAELFSQLDAAVSLRVLTVLPGFGNESLGVDYIAWRQMQTMVDWLFAQVADEAPAQDAINDLVRVCLLLAAHAPVKRIISARIRRPVPAVINTRLDIEIDPKVTRIGMQVLVHSPATQTLLARAVVEDLADGVATARITHAPAGPSVTLDASLRVQVQAGPPLTTANVQRAEAAKVQADAVPKAAAAPAVKRAQAEVDAVAEKRVARQVEALRVARR